MAKHDIKNDTILALDLGTTFVKAILAHRRKDGSLEILGTGIAKQFPASMHCGAITDIPTVTSVCERAVGAAEKVAGIRAKNVIIGVSGEFVKGETTAIHYSRGKKPKPITEAEMAVLLKKAQDNARAAAKSQLAIETVNPEVSVRLINSSVVSINIDGCDVNNPIGFRGSDVKVRFYTAFAPLVQISAIEKICAELSLNLLSVVVEPFAICRAYLGDSGDTSSALFLDIGGGTTDLALIKKGGIEGTKTFAIGSDSAEKDPSIWFDGLTISLGDFTKFGELPTKILLSGGGAKNLDLVELIATSDWYQSLGIRKRPTLELIDPTKFEGFIYNRQSIEIDESYTTAMGLLRVASDVLADEPKNKLTERIAQILKN